MLASVFDLFKLGVGPSSSHTMGPMTAAARFVALLEAGGGLAKTARVETTLYGSLALTGRGHATDRAVILGLAGFAPASLDPDAGVAALARIEETGRMALRGAAPEIGFDAARDIVWAGRERKPQHPNALKFAALDASGEIVLERTYFSIGGGFVRDEDEIGRNEPGDAGPDLPHPYESGADLLARAEAAGLTIAQLMLANERARRPEADIEAELDAIHAAMEACIERGMRVDGSLPGGLNVRRRARPLHASILARIERQMADPLGAMDWINLWALAVNEENASGGRVVTAPTNGAAGIIPAVLHYYTRFMPGSNQQGVIDFLMTAAAIGILYKLNASISGAEVGCQGEVGVACSMAAGALAAVMGGTPEQVENAAEIGMEHNLGLTCDPVGGMVQIPCIERNAMASVKAVNAARMALRGDGSHYVSLDSVIKTMRETGADMKTKYKETSRGGLAVNIVEC